MRKKIILQHKWDEYIVWELTVEQYLKLNQENPDEVLEYDILKEFNENKPNLSDKDKGRLMNTLFNIVEDDNIEKLLKGNKGKSKMWLKDYHIIVWRVMKMLNQQYSEIMQMPIRYFNKIVEDLDIIVGEKDYDEKRNSWKVDKKSLKEQFGEIDGKKKINA